jgi:hypothetical protein
MNIEYFGDDLINLAFWNADDYVNVTSLSQCYFEKTGKKKLPNNWLRLDGTKEYINYVSSQTGIDVDSLVRIAKGGNLKDEQGTFLHPDLVIPFATWLSPEFSYRVTKIIQERIVSGAIPNYMDSVKLRELLKKLNNYLPTIEKMGQDIHSTVHQQISSVRDSIKLIEKVLKNY